jgi:hypothetical protein
MERLPGLIVDNFFENPDEVRLHALAQRTYEPADFYVPGIYSGYRAEINNKEIDQYIKSKIETLFSKKVGMLILRFHLNTESSICGCPHHDLDGKNSHEKMFAGVIYLNPNLSRKDCGTTIYGGMGEEQDDYGFKMQIVYDIALPPTNLIKQRFAQDMRNYKKTLSVVQKCDNVYNRAILYPAYIYHSPDEYFGTNLDDGRLTISIHGTFE